MFDIRYCNDGRTYYYYPNIELELCSLMVKLPCSNTDLERSLSCGDSKFCTYTAWLGVLNIGAYIPLMWNVLTQV